MDKKSSDMKIAVYDLGGGTFDISILELGDGVFEVKSTNGDTHLGGDDFDHVLIDYMAEAFKAEHQIAAPGSDGLAASEGSCREGEDRTSSSTSTEINLPHMPSTAFRSTSLCSSRVPKFEQLCDQFDPQDHRALQTRF